MNTRVTVVGSDSSSRILDQQEYIGNSYVLLNLVNVGHV